MNKTIKTIRTNLDAARVSLRDALGVSRINTAGLLDGNAAWRAMIAADSAAVDAAAAAVEELEAQLDDAIHA